MQLLNVLLPAHHAGRDGVGLDERTLFARRLPAAVQRFRLLNDLVPVIVARQRQHGAFRAVHAAHIVSDALARERGNAGLGAQDGTRDRLVAVMRQHQKLKHQILRRILGHVDLLDHHALFAFDVRGIQTGGQHQIADYVHRQRQVLVHNLGVEAGAFLAGERVQLSADGVHFLGNVARGALFGALEQHVLDKVTDAVFAGRFILRTAFHPQTHRHGAVAGHVLADDAQTVRQRLQIKCHICLQ